MTAILLSLLTAASTTMLFVGNSYTFGNDGLWSITRNLYESVTGDTLIALHHTQGGASFQDHWNNADLLEMIQTLEIDMAIFQGQSLLPVIEPEMTYQYGDSLALLCVDNAIQPSFLMTWPRKNDHLMLKGLMEGYSRMGYEHMCPVAPCGIGFYILQGRYPLLDLYLGDGSHPSLEGSYLAACIIAISVLDTDISSPDAWRPPGISQGLGEVIREAALEACNVYLQPMGTMGR